MCSVTCVDENVCWDRVSYEVWKKEWVEVNCVEEKRDRDSERGEKKNVFLCDFKGKV